MQTVSFTKNLTQKKIEIDMLNEKSGQSRFNNCEFRSDEVISKQVKRCACQGGTYTVSGYQCLKRNIFNISPEICAFCSYFKNKSA